MTTMNPAPAVNTHASLRSLFAALALLAGTSVLQADNDIVVKKLDVPAEPKPRPSLSPEEIRAKGRMKNFEVVGQVPLTWPGAGGQIALSGKYVYVALIPPAIGVDIVDVSNPSAPKVVGHFEPPGAPDVHSHKVRVCGNTLVTNAERNRVAQPEKWQGGLVVWDITQRTKPRLLSFVKVPGVGVHRVFFDCSTQRVYMNAPQDGFLEQVEWVLDLKNPLDPQLLSRFWYPGQKDGEPRDWEPGRMNDTHPKRLVRPHNVMPVGDRLYAAWWDAGLTIWDIKDIKEPKLLGASSTKPPDQGAMHSAYPIRGYPLVVTNDEWFNCPQGYVRIWNVHNVTNPLQISTFQLPIDRQCPEPGPRDLHSAHSIAEPSTFAEQDWPVHLIFVTWFSQGLRVLDISDPYRPLEAGYFEPPVWPGAKEGLFDGHAIAYGSDAAIDWRNRLVYFTDRVDIGGGGLYVLKWTGDDKDKPIAFITQ